ncbi:MAG: hypothetical protein IT449_10845 [Phycisphaerales bacterium]|nr:hypothetical protein [Phycisphaerales bacterium]
MSGVEIIIGATSLLAALQSEVIRDSLCMTDLQVYERYYPNFCGGEAIFGISYSLQAADAFSTTKPFFIIGVTFDFLVLSGAEPESACIAFYANPRPCEVDEEPTWSQALAGGSFSWEPFDELVYPEFEGRRAFVVFSEPPLLTAGGWAVGLQPVSYEDFGGTPAISFSRAVEYECIDLGDALSRETTGHESCCNVDGDWGWYKDWHCDGSFEPDTLSMRVEGIPAGDCVGGERVRARCKTRDGEQVGDVVVKVRSGQPDGAVTALLDPPDPTSMSIALDDRGRGKGKFKDAPLGAHRVFVCDSIIDVTCAP